MSARLWAPCGHLVQVGTPVSTAPAQGHKLRPVMDPIRSCGLGRKPVQIGLSPARETPPRGGPACGPAFHTLVMKRWNRVSTFLNIGIDARAAQLRPV